MNQSEARIIAVDTARGILDKRVEFLEGVRLLAKLRFNVGVSENDEDFLSFTAAASEMDTFPGRDQRSLWSKRALQIADKELIKMQDFYTQEIEKACKNLIDRF